MIEQVTASTARGSVSTAGGSISAALATGIGVGPFSFHAPTRIHFGRGAREVLGDALPTLGSRIALVTGSSFAGGRHRDSIERAIERGGTIVSRQVSSGEPDVVAVLAAASAFRTAGAEVVVAIGGGSTIDLAKAAALLLDAAALRDHLAGRLRVERAEGVPVVAIPTTAGSGSEVSHAAIILDRSAGRKRGVRGPGVAARMAIVDPDLLDDLPPTVAASSGFDAIAHAIETSVSIAATPHVVALAGIALPRLLRAVPRIVARNAIVTDLDDAAYAALLMGLNLAASTTCLPHRLQYPIGALTGTSHARGVAALLPAWLRRTSTVAPGRLAALSVAAGLAGVDEPALTAAEHLRTAVSAHLEATGMRLGLAELGVSPDDVGRLVDAVEGTLANDPGLTSPSDLRALYLESM